MPTFTTIFKNELLDLLETRVNGICQNENVEYSKGEYHVIFDGYIEKADETVIIEIEFRRGDPVHNLIKTLHWICHSIRNRKIKMIQIYDENYYSINKNKYKREFTLFLAKRCNLLHKKLSEFRYMPVSIKVEQKAFRKNDAFIAKKLARTTYRKILNMV